MDSSASGVAEAGNADGELEGAGDPVAEPTFGVDGQRGLTERRARQDDGAQQGQAHR